MTDPNPLTPDQFNFWQDAVLHHLTALETIQKALAGRGVPPEQLDDLFMIRVVELGAAELEKKGQSDGIPQS